jgi:hypothetical protein
VPTNSTNLLDIFYDDNATRPSIASLTVAQNTLSSSKYLSGVRFYSINDTFDIDLTANNVYRNTYSAQQIIIDPTQFGASSFNLDETDNEASGISDPPNLADPFSYSGTITTSNSNIWNSDARISAYGQDPMGAGSSSYTAYDGYLVLTYGNVADDITEYFRDEYYRLPNGTYNSIPGSITGQWTSSNALANGNAQVWPNLLLYPDTDYTAGYNPAQTADYSGFSGSQVYLRALRDSGTPHTNIIISFSPWTVAAWPYSNIQIEFKLPTQTGWLRGDLPYNNATFTGIDGDGCYVAGSSSGSSFYFTFGGFSTASSGYMVIMRITYTNNSSLTELASLTATNW